MDMIYPHWWTIEPEYGSLEARSQEGMTYLWAMHLPHSFHKRLWEGPRREQSMNRRRLRGNEEVYHLSDANHGTSSSHSGARHVIGRGEPLMMTHLMVEMVFFFFLAGLSMFGCFIAVWMYIKYEVEIIIAR